MQLSRTVYAADNAFKTLIIGAGAGGMALQHRMVRYHNDPKSVAVVEPNDTHYYQPLWTLVGGGKKSLEESGRKMIELMHPKAWWYKDQVASFQPEQNQVTLT